MDTKDRIRTIIENEGLTQVEFSERTGIKPPTLSHVLTGRNNPSTDVIQKILDAFPHYSVDWLLNGRGEMLGASSGIDQISAMSTNPSVVSLFGAEDGGASDFRNGGAYNYPPKNSTQTPLSGRPSIPNYRTPGLPNFAPSEVASTQPKRTVTKIIVFYDDNTYETFIHGEEKKTK